MPNRVTVISNLTEFKQLNTLAVRFNSGCQATVTSKWLRFPQTCVLDHLAEQYLLSKLVHFCDINICGEPEQQGTEKSIK